MLRRLEQAVSLAVAEVAIGGYLTHGIADEVEVRLVIEAPELASAEVLALVGDAVTELMGDPDTLGWGPFSVNVTDEIPDLEDSLDLDDAVDLPEDDGARAGERFDREALRRRLRGDAAHLAGGLDLGWLTCRDVDDADPAQLACALAEAQYVAGALFQAAVLIVDHLFIDVDTLKDAGEIATVAGETPEAFFVLDELPARYAHRYDVRFAQALLVATVDVTRRLTAGWEPLACVAEELALRLILNQAEAQLDVADVDLDDDWRGAVEDALFEDVDHELLYDEAADGIEDDPEALAILRMAPMAFTDWFKPFNPDRPLPPYLLERSLEA
jgi:hypothetical protein